jgi:hypothetical protein
VKTSSSGMKAVATMMAVIMMMGMTLMMTTTSVNSGVKLAITENSDARRSTTDLMQLIYMGSAS